MHCNWYHCYKHEVMIAARTGIANVLEFFLIAMQSIILRVIMQPL